MKNMKKLLQKAMVFTLTAAMLIGTPLTASAASLLDLYEIEDGAGNVTGNTDNSNTNTETDTNTDTNTRPIDDAKVLGIVLDQANVHLMSGRTQKLTATLDWGNATLDDEDRALEAELLNSLVWKSDDATVAAITPMKKSPNVATVRARSGGNTVITVSLDSDEHNLHYAATANVTVFQYADKLRFNNDKIAEDAYTGNSLVLDEYVDRYIGDTIVAETADTLTYTLIDDGGRKATLKNGVLKLNKPTEPNKPVKVMASGKNVRTENVGIVNITAGTNATKLTFSGTGIKGSKLTWLANDGLTTEVTAKVSGKKSVDSTKKNAASTDKITWSSANTDIVEIEKVIGGDKSDGTGSEKEVNAGDAVNFKNDECTVALRFYKAGKAQIIGKVSSGKTFKLNVTVSADLTSVVLGEKDTLYTGQIIDLNDRIVLQRFAGGADSDSFEAEGLVKWEFTDKRNMGKLAKLNAKTGALEIKADLKKENLDDTKEITVRAIAAKKGRNIKPFAPVVEKENEITFDLKQVNIRSITVTKEDAERSLVSVESGKPQTPKNAADSIDVGPDKTQVYILSARGSIEGVEGEDNDLTMALGWTASGNGKIIRTTKAGNYGYLTALKKGSAKITASGVTQKANGKYAAIKATFKDTVNAPSEHITLSVKNKDITAKYKRGAIAEQKITIKPVLDKGSTTKNKATGTDIIDWSATLYDKDGNKKNDLDITLGRLTLKGYAIGDQVVVNATVKNSGASDTIIMTVVNPTKKVVFKKYAADGVTPETDPIGKTGVEVPEGGINVCAYIESSADGEAGVADGVVRTGVASYTVSGKGAVFVKVGENGKITIEPLKAGAATIKFVMTDGKKATLKATVASDPSWMSNVENMTSFISNMFK